MSLITKIVHIITKSVNANRLLILIILIMGCSCCFEGIVSIKIKGDFEAGNILLKEMPNVKLKNENSIYKYYIVEVQNNECNSIYLYVTEDTSIYRPNVIQEYDEKGTVNSYSIVENFDCTLLYEIHPKSEKKFLLISRLFQDSSLKFVYKKNNLEYEHEIKCSVNPNTKKIVNCRTISINQKN